MSIPGEDGVHTQVLTVPKRIRNQKISGATSAHTSGRLIVVTINDFHPTLKALHQTTGHGKERIMLHKVADHYEGLPKCAVKKYISMCRTCSRNNAQVIEAPPRVKFSQGLFYHCQVLIRLMAAVEVISYLEAEVLIQVVSRKFVLDMCISCCFK